MNILHYCAHSGGFIYDWHLFHMVDELKRAGHNVTYFNPVEALGHEDSLDKYSEVLLDTIKKDEKGVDFFFATATDDTLLPEAIEEIRKLGIVTVNLSCDDLSHPFRVRNVAGCFDLNWTTVRENAGILRSYGANVLVMPWGANPHVFKPVETREDRVVGFIGTTYGARARNLALLQFGGVPIRVHGKAPDKFYKSTSRINNPAARVFANAAENWERLSSGLTFEAGRKCIAGVIWRSVLEATTSPPEKRLDNHRVEYLSGPSFPNMARCFNEMAISLGSTELASTYVLKNPVLFIRLREFEVPMSGGVHLVNRCAELAEYFEEDKEMLFYSDGEELVDKAKYYLDPARDHVRKIIRQQARRRAESDHTWLARFRVIGKKLSLRF